MNLSTSALERGVASFNRWRRDAMDHIDAAIEADPACTIAHAVKGLVLTTGRNVSLADSIDECLTSARTARPSDAVEHAYVRALAHAAGGRVCDAVTEYQTIINATPDDLFAHRMAQQELFWIGEFDWMRDIAKRAMPHWDRDHPDYGPLLAVAAFSHEEAGEHAVAERLGRESVERDPSECWGAHAVAHVLEMQHRYDEGEQWLRGLCGNWEDANQIAHHLWWHLCLFLLEAGKHDEILALLSDKVRNLDDPLVQAVPDAYIDIQNVASLLFRLELLGVEVGAHWHSIADVSAGRIDNHPSPFTSAHAAMTLAACGRFEEANALVASLEQAARGDADGLGPRIAVSALPAAKAAIAHRKGDRQCVVDLLMPVRRSLKAMGGSHAQRDVFVQMLADACAKLGKRDYLDLIGADLEDLGFSKVRERSGYRNLL